jgi:hypothetical protein
MVVIDMELTLADDSEIYLVGIIDVPIKNNFDSNYSNNILVNIIAHKS